MNLKSKVVLITGSSARVGKVIALTIAQKGAKVVIDARQGHYRFGVRRSSGRH